jgi:hypothetical protein
VIRHAAEHQAPDEEADDDRSHREVAVGHLMGATGLRAEQRSAQSETRDPTLQHVQRPPHVQVDTQTLCRTYFRRPAAGGAAGTRSTSSTSAGRGGSGEPASRADASSQAGAIWYPRSPVATDARRCRERRPALLARRDPSVGE